MPYPTQWAHNDPQKFMCAICFQILGLDRCAVVDDQKIDICAPCIEMEKAMMQKHNKEEFEKEMYDPDRSIKRTPKED